MSPDVLAAEQAAMRDRWTTTTPRSWCDQSLAAFTVEARESGSPDAPDAVLAIVRESERKIDRLLREQARQAELISQLGLLVADLLQASEGELVERKRLPRRSGVGFVYLMRDEATDLYKIGHSIHPQVRERTLQSEKPAIKMLAHWPGTRLDERILHARFESKRVRGEWFKLSTADLSSLTSGNV